MNCRRCGRALHTPESVEAGIGPKCHKAEVEAADPNQMPLFDEVSTITSHDDQWFKWNPAVSTDVTATFRKFGWVPPSEDPAYLRKWRDWKARFSDAPTQQQPEPLPVNVISGTRWKRAAR